MKPKKPIKRTLAHRLAQLEERFTFEYTERQKIGIALTKVREKLAKLDDDLSNQIGAYCKNAEFVAQRFSDVEKDMKYACSQIKTILDRVAMPRVIPNDQGFRLDERAPQEQHIANDNKVYVVGRGWVPLALKKDSAKEILQFVYEAKHALGIIEERLRK